MQLLKLLKKQEPSLELADLPLPPLPSLPSIEGKLCGDELDFDLPPFPDETADERRPAAPPSPRSVLPTLGLPPLPPPPKPSKSKSATCLPEISRPSFPKRAKETPAPLPPLPSFSLPPLPPPPPREGPASVAPFPKLNIPSFPSLPPRETAEEESCTPHFPEIPALFRKPRMEPGQEAPATLPDLELPSLPPLSPPRSLPPRPAPLQRLKPLCQEEQAMPMRPTAGLCLPQRGVMFIRSEEYTCLQTDLQEARQAIKQAGSSLDRTNAIKNREDTGIDALKTCLETIQRKLGYVDKAVFECKEQ